MDRKTILSAETRKIQSRLDRWSKKNLDLQPGERVAVSLAIHGGSRQEILAMLSKDYFTKQRFENAGVPLRYNWMRITNIAYTASAGFEDQSKGIPIHERTKRCIPFLTIGSIVEAGKAKLLEIEYFGERGLEAVEQILKHDGIELPA